MTNSASGPIPFNLVCNACEFRPMAPGQEVPGKPGYCAECLAEAEPVEAPLDLARLVLFALEDSRFAAADVVHYAPSWDGRDVVAIRWAWSDDERAALIAHLRQALPAAVLVTDRVESVTASVPASGGSYRERVLS